MRSYLTALALLMLPICAFAAEEARDSDLLPEFALTATSGLDYQLPRNQEGVGVYLFWASWCPYCRALMPHLQSIVMEYGDELTVYALQFRDDDSAEDYVSRFGYDFVVFDEADAVAQSWGVRGTPAVIVLDQQGQVKFNLYDLLDSGPEVDPDLPHGLKASRLAPYWAARLRQSIDAALSRP